MALLLPAYVGRISLPSSSMIASSSAYLLCGTWLLPDPCNREEKGHMHKSPNPGAWHDAEARGRGPGWSPQALGI